MMVNASWKTKPPTLTSALTLLSVYLLSSCGGSGGGSSGGAIATNIATNAIVYCSGPNGYPVASEEEAKRCCQAPEYTERKSNAPEECNNPAFDAAIFEYQQNSLDRSAGANLAFLAAKAAEDPEGEAPEVTTQLNPTRSAAIAENKKNGQNFKNSKNSIRGPKEDPKEQSATEDFNSSPSNAKRFSGSKPSGPGLASGLSSPVPSPAPTVTPNTNAKSQTADSGSTDSSPSTYGTSSGENSFATAASHSNSDGVRVSGSSNAQDVDFKKDGDRELASIEDPQDYFNRISPFSNLFEVVQTRYQIKAKRWALYEQKKNLERAEALSSP